MTRRDLLFGFTVFFLTATITIMFGIGRNVLVIMWPEIMKLFSITYSEVGYLTALHQGAYFFASLAAGRLALSIRPEVIISAATVAGGGLILSIGFLDSSAMLYLVYGTLGALIALAWVPMLRYAAISMPAKKRVAALSVAACGTALGFLINGFVIPPAMEIIGLRLLWPLLGMVTILIGAFGYAVLNSYSRISADKISSKVGAGRKSAGDGKRFPKATFCLILFFCGVGLVSFQTYYSAYLVEDLSFSESKAANAWIIPGSLGLLSGFVLTFLSNRLSVKVTVQLCIITLGAAILVLSVIKSNNVALLSGIVYGLFYFGLFGLFPAYLANTIHDHDASRVFGRANLFLGLGSVAGGIIGGNIAHYFGSFSLFWLIASLSAAISLLLTLRLPSDRVPALYATKSRAN